MPKNMVLVFSLISPTSYFLYDTETFHFLSCVPPPPHPPSAAWVCPLWKHSSTVKEWVCQTANNLHSSCLICSRLHSSSHDTGAGSMSGPIAHRVKVYGSGKSHTGSRQAGAGYKQQAVEEANRQLDLSLIQDNILFFFNLSRNGLLTMQVVSSNAKYSNSGSTHISI